MDNLIRGRTTIIIAHRLSTLRKANRIVALENGEIVEVGNHKVLMKNDGLYSQLYNAQFEKERVKESNMEGLLGARAR